jgi:hypothetical protein
MEPNLYVYDPETLDTFPAEIEDNMDVDYEEEKEEDSGYGYSFDDEIDYEKWYKFYMQNKDF